MWWRCTCSARIRNGSALVAVAPLSTNCCSAGVASMKRSVRAITSSAPGFAHRLVMQVLPYELPNLMSALAFRQETFQLLNWVTFWESLRTLYALPSERVGTAVVDRDPVSLTG
jgi:hypothetical protein